VTVRLRVPSRRFELGVVDVPAADHDRGGRTDRLKLLQQNDSGGACPGAFDSLAVRGPEPRDRLPDLLLFDRDHFVDRVLADVQRGFVDLPRETVGERRKIL